MPTAAALATETAAGFTGSLLHGWRDRPFHLSGPGIAGDTRCADDLASAVARTWTRWATVARLTTLARYFAAVIHRCLESIWCRTVRVGRGGRQYWVRRLAVGRTFGRTIFNRRSSPTRRRCGYLGWSGACGEQTEDGQNQNTKSVDHVLSPITPYTLVERGRNIGKPQRLVISAKHPQVTKTVTVTVTPTSRNTWI